MILDIILYLLVFCAGFLVGVRNCKKAFGIPKRAKAHDGSFVLNVPCETVEVDVNGCN